MFYNSFIIRCLGVLAPFLCLVRTFRVGFHSVQLSKGSKWASSDSGSARRFSALPFCCLPLSSYHYYFSSFKKIFYKRERERPRLSKEPQSAAEC